MATTANIADRVYDASCLSDYLGCPKYFYYRWIKRLVPKDEPAPLIFGRAFHSALQRWYEGVDLEECVKEFLIIPKLIEDDRRTRERGESVFREYVERWGKDIDMFEVLYLEKVFHIDMPNDRVYTGRLDVVVKDRSNEQIYIKDHKTTAQLGLAFYRQFRPHVQMDGYCYACKELCGECSGAIINGISIAKNPKERFGREVSPRTPDELKKFEEQFTLWSEKLETDIVRKSFAMHYNHCTHWGTCTYWDLCVYGDDERSVEQKFKVDDEVLDEQGNRVENKKDS